MTMPPKPSPPINAFVLKIEYRAWTSFWGVPIICANATSALADEVLAALREVGAPQLA
jgi:hypothetical protein